MKCKHRGYQAKRRPRVNCEACWRKYIGKHPFVDVLISDENFWIAPKTHKVKWKFRVSKDAPWH
jgi:hypothetical protein